MEFKQSSKKRKINFSDPVAPLKLAPKKTLKWFEDDKEWQDLRINVKKDVLNSKTKKQRKFFAKKLRPFDDPTQVLPKKRSKVAKSIKTGTKRLKTSPIKPFVKKNKKPISLVCILVVIGLFALNKLVLDKNHSEAGVAGVSSTANKTGNDLPREKPKFKILYPGTKNADTVGEIVRVSPANTASVYTYVDRVGDVQINISQQELPSNFKINQDGELEKLATSFQAKNIIQVDSIKVYHGSSTSGVQSLLFIKGNLLFTVRASQKISDETWAAYISALHS